MREREAEGQRGDSIHKASTSLIKCDTALWADDSLLIRDALFSPKKMNVLALGDTYQLVLRIYEDSEE